MSKDHKRKARPIAPATVTCDANSITVVIPDVLGKNESHVAGRNGERHTSTATKNYRKSIESGHALASIERGALMLVAAEGSWRAEILSVWPRKRDVINGQKIDFVCPMGDVDAPIAQVFDALQHAGILDDDARVCEVKAWNMYRKDMRCTVVRLRRVVCGVSHEYEHLMVLAPRTAGQNEDGV